MGRSMTWITDQGAPGWACSQCAWRYPIPTLLTDPEAKEAYDRLASTKFQEHDCTENPRRAKTTDCETFMARMRDLVMRGFKPKDAAELVLQEVMLEHRNDPEILKQARAEAEEFLRRIRAGRL